MLPFVMSQGGGLIFSPASLVNKGNLDMCAVLRGGTETPCYVLDIFWDIEKVNMSVLSQP
jgi:hypothetical protein